LTDFVAAFRKLDSPRLIQVKPSGPEREQNVFWRTNPHREVRITRSGFQLIRATAVAFAFFAGFTIDVSPAVWQSGTVISQAEAVRQVQS
jgi:hypothetical protein